MSKFLIVKDGKAIKCLGCGRVSHHPMNIKFRFCAACDKFIDPDRPAWHEMTDALIREMGQFRFAQYMSQEAKDEARKRKGKLDELQKEHKEHMARLDVEYREERDKSDRFFRRIMVILVCISAFYLIGLTVMTLIKYFGE